MFERRFIQGISGVFSKCVFLPEGAAGESNYSTNPCEPRVFCSLCITLVLCCSTWAQVLSGFVATGFPPTQDLAIDLCGYGASGLLLYLPSLKSDLFVRKYRGKPRGTKRRPPVEKLTATLWKPGSSKQWKSLQLWKSGESKNSKVTLTGQWFASSYK